MIMYENGLTVGGLVIVSLSCISLARCLLLGFFEKLFSYPPKHIVAFFHYIHLGENLVYECHPVPVMIWLPLTLVSVRWKGFGGGR